MDQWTKEALQAARRLRRAPVFSVTILCVFVVAIGIATAVTSLALGIFEQAVPYDEASRLVELYETNESQGIEFMQSSVPTHQVFREQSSIFEELGLGHAPINLTLSSSRGGERVIGGLVSPSLFSTLGIEMALGRPFGADEEGFGTAAQAVVISHELWTRRFAADAALLGTTVVVNGAGWTVVGVLPPRTPLLPTVAERIEVWLPLGHAEGVFGSDVSQVHNFRAFWTIGLLRSGVDETRAREEIRTISARISEMFPETSGDWDWEIRPLISAVTQQLRGATVTLVAGALILLVVAIANVVGLFVQRARGTTRAAAVRLAVGATRIDLLRTASTEAAILAIPGTLGGLVFARVAIASYSSWTPFPLPPFMQIGLDPRVVAAAALLAVATVAVAGATMSWWWTRSAARRRVGTRGGRAWYAARLGLGLQASLAAMLTVTGLLTARSFVNLADAPVGLDPERLLTARVDVPAELRPAGELSRTADEILEQLRALPEVSNAALWSPHVPAAATWHSKVAVFSRPDLQEANDMPLVRIHQIGHQAATLLGMRFAAGRDFTAADRTSGARVVLVSATAAQQWWGSENPIGRRIRRWNHNDWSTVVGVVEDAPLAGRSGVGTDLARDVFFLHDQDPQAYLVFLMRIRGEGSGVMRAAEEAVHRAAPDLPVYGIRFMEDILGEQEQITRSTAMLGVIFAVAALVLVGVGLYGILASLVGEKSAEISLRKALGASSGRIVHEVTMPAFVVLVVGGVVGLGIARAVLPALIVDSLFGVDPTQGALYGLAVVILLVTTVPALIGPARKGSRQDPVQALRQGVGG